MGFSTNTYHTLIADTGEKHNLLTEYLWPQIQGELSSVWKCHCIAVVIHCLTLYDECLIYFLIFQTPNTSVLSSLSANNLGSSVTKRSIQK